MYRKLKTNIAYKKDGIEIRKAHAGEEYEVGNWISSYELNKIGYESYLRDTRYSDIIYVMTLNHSIVGYFMAYNEVNIGDNPNLELYSKELILYDFAVSMRACVKYSRILMDYLIKYANYNGYKAISFTKEENYSGFTDFINRYYNSKEIDGKIYLINENPRIRSCQKYLTIYENDKVTIEDLYFLYDLKFDIQKTKCTLKLNDNDSIILDRLTGFVTFPKNVNILKDKVMLNSKTYNLLYLITNMYFTNEIEIVNVLFDVNNPDYFEACVNDLLYISKDYNEIKNDLEYQASLIQKGYKRFVPKYLNYNMNESSFHFIEAIYELK